MWALTGRAAIGLGDKAMMRKIEAALTPAAVELAGAGSGMLTVGPVCQGCWMSFDELDHLPPLRSVASGPIRLGAMPNSRSIRLGPAAFNRAMKDAPRNL